MLDAETKRRIDTARDILVGKVPDPKSQVEQITIALIYKFMDDMDSESEELGGNRKFFAGEFAQYGWPKLVRSGLGGHEVLNLYSEAITRMPENPGIPPLFRDIFKNAFLPYRDPETLRAFLKIIDEFEYDHSERLGDAFEYLLSVLGSQGDAGQFRTPRHIIDFIVSIVGPKKDETILDPACGTAGFLISSYKHILKSNTDEKGHSTLTPDEKGKLADNFKGYDISPDMVRLSLVNLYLHGFVAPQVYEYDTLTSEERWNEYADVVLANPPFMSPKGGIRPHNRFSVKSKRSEVLFVDYMAEHLTPNGRAGIIVPEGIVFKSENAYKQLRKMLVEEYLVAVISLPTGVFNPYSGVKTSILILDKALTRRRDRIGFFKVENDGFDLGAQRKSIDENDLPEIRQAVCEYLNMDEQDIQDKDSSESMLNTLTGQGSVQIVAKERIAADGEYNLSGERYRENTRVSTTFPFIPIGEICTVNPPKSELHELPSETKVSFVPMADLKENRISFVAKKYEVLGEVGTSYTYFADNDVLLAKVTPCFENGKAGIARNLENGIGFGSSEFYVLRSSQKVLPEWIYFCVTHPLFRQSGINNMTGTGGLQRVPRKFIQDYEIPLPPLEVQREIVAEIESYQKVIDGARTVVENYRPHIALDPEWPTVDLESICNEILSGGTPPTNHGEYWKGEIPWITSADIINFKTAKPRKYITEEAIKESATNLIKRGNIIVVTRVGLGKLFKNNFDVCISQDSQGLILKDVVNADYLLYVLKDKVINFKKTSQGSTIQGVTKKQLAEIEIPLPSLEVQQNIVREIEAEQSLVSANQELIERMGGKIRTAIGRVWNEEKNNQDENNSELVIFSGSDQIPSGLDHIRMLSMLGEKSRRFTGSKLSDHEHELKILGISLSILYQAGTCHRKCFGGPHILEAISGRTYNLACGAYILICRGLYDEALNLIRSMGEISNLFALFLTDKDAHRLWLQSDKRERLNKFSPVKVRKSLEQQESELMHATQDWYSKFCEDYTHIHPGTRPNVHNEQDKSYIGGVVQKDGLKNSIDELTTVCTYIAIFVSKYAELDDLFEELVEAVKK